MSFTVSIGTVTKRKNSTYVPTTELSTDIDVVLKESCSDYAPVFILENSSNTFTHNYLKWGDWYYFIDDVIREKNHMVTIKCNLDALATYKAYITASTQFVAYDATANTEVIDTRLSVNTTEIASVFSDSSGSFFETGCILLGAVGTQNTGVFAVSFAQLKAILNSIFTNYLNNNNMLPVPSIGTYTDIDDAADAIVHNLVVGLRQLIATGKAPDSIKSCIYIPVPDTAFSGSSADVWLGDYDTDITAKLLDPSARATELHTLTIPWNFTDWRKNAPYSHVYIKLPYTGIVPITTSEIVNATAFNITTFVNQNGDISHLVYAAIGGNNVYIGRYGGNCASNILVGASGLNPLQTILGGAAIAGGAVTALANPLVGGSAAIAGFTSAIQPLTASAGNGGGGAYTDDPIYQCSVISHNTNVDPTSVSVFMGTPTMAVKSLSGLTGYVECRNASVSAPTSESVLQEINNYLNGGVYLE